MFGNTSQLLMRQKLMSTHDCPEMHQCTLRLISMWATSLFWGVICQWTVNKLQTGESKKKKLHAKCQVQLSLIIETQILQYNTRCTSFSIMNWGTVIFCNMTLDIKSRTSYDGTCFYKWNFPCDDQICINDTLS